jgi:membrane-bound serine protease (ClpP class)
MRKERRVRMRVFIDKTIFLINVLLILLVSSAFIVSVDIHGESKTLVKGVLVEVTPPWDTIDNGVAECVADAVKFAEDSNAVLIYKVNSYGGYLDSGFTIGDAIYYSKVPTIAYVENKALSAGTLIIIPADIIILQKGSIIGAMKPVMVNPVTGEVTFVNESKILEPIIGKAKVYSERRSRNLSLIAEFITNAKVVDSNTAVSSGVADFEVNNYYEIFDLLKGRVIEKNGVQYSLNLNQGNVEVFACSIRSRMISILSNAYLANALLSIGVLAAIFALASGKIVVLPLAFALILLGLISTGINPNMLSVFFIILGAIMLAIELFILPGFGFVGVSGIVLITLGFALLPAYIPAGVSPRQDYIAALRAFIFGTAITLGSFFGLVVFKVIQVRRKKPVSFTPEGKEGVAIEDIKPGETGFVKVEGEYWRATSNNEIKAGERIMVLKMREDGVLVVDRKTVSQG